MLSTCCSAATCTIQAAGVHAGTTSSDQPLAPILKHAAGDIAPICVQWQMTFVASTKDLRFRHLSHVSG